MQSQKNLKKICCEQIVLSAKNRSHPDSKYNSIWMIDTI
jgi:hypothetical protein